MSDLVFNETLGRRIRGGGAAEALGVPTDRLAIDAVREGRARDASELLEYLIEEAGRIHWLFSTWLRSLLDYAQEHLADAARERRRLERMIGVPPPFVEPQSVALGEQAAARAALAEGVEPFAVALRALRERHWNVHDAQADWCWGLLTVLQDELGEQRMGDVFRVTQGDWLAQRYESVGRMAPRELFELTIEGMRGHYCGSARSGDIHVEEDEEKWVMSFDPCGTGGRMRRGDSERNQTPRTEPPYGFAHVKGAYDWTWSREDVCLYCAHCAVVNEILPIEQLGTPMRVTGYPDAPSGPCTWTVYKSPEQVPDWAFERVGKTREP